MATKAFCAFYIDDIFLHSVSAPFLCPVQVLKGCFHSINYVQGVSLCVEELYSQFCDSIHNSIVFGWDVSPQIDYEIILFSFVVYITNYHSLIYSLTCRDIFLKKSVGVVPYLPFLAACLK